MRRIAMIGILLGAMCALAGCVTTETDRPSPAIGSKFTGSFDVGNNVQIPLPEGEWELTSNGAGTNSGGQHFYRPALVQIKNGVLHGIIMANSALNDARAPGFGEGYVFNKDCTRNDVLYAKVASNFENGPQDCWGINHFTMTLGQNTPREYVERNKYLQDRRIAIPITMVAVGFHFADRAPHYLDVLYYWNPEADGFSPPKNSEWRSSDWHKDRVYLDPKKVAYIEGLKTWGASWHERVKAGFNRTLTTASTQRAATASSQPSAPQTPSVESRLRELETLRDKGLIDAQEFDQKRKEILNTL